MKERWPVQWQFQEEQSPADNLASLAFSLDMLARHLESFGEVGARGGNNEMTIHPYTFLLLGEVAQSMANEAQKLLGCLMNTRRAKKGNQGPGKLVHFDRSSLKAEDEVKEESDEKQQ